MDDERVLAELAEEQLDELDAATLGQVRAIYSTGDPVPADLVERVHFALALDEVYDEVARMTRLPQDSLAVRGDAPAGTRTETLTFSADRLTAMVTLTRLGHGRLRLDGWLAPPSAVRVRLRLQGGGEHDVLADEQGRFSFDSLPEGFGQLSFHADADADAGSDGADDAANAVVTPLFQL